MDVETIRFNTTVKFGEKVYLKGEVLNAPFPSVVTSELRHNTGTITVLKRFQPIPIQKPPIEIVENVPIPAEVLTRKRGRKPKK